jgi:hypothetical protein
LRPGATGRAPKPFADPPAGGAERTTEHHRPRPGPAAPYSGAGSGSGGSGEGSGDGVGGRGSGAGSGGPGVGIGGCGSGITPRSAVSLLIDTSLPVMPNVKPGRP